MVQEQGQSGEVALETKAATLAQLVLLSEYQGHLQNFKLVQVSDQLKCAKF
jgi:hypothetical protein